MKRGRFDFIAGWLMISAFFIFACRIQESENIHQISPQISPTMSPSLETDASPAPSPQSARLPKNSSIKIVDFKNFTYHYPDSSETFTLRNGVKEQTEEMDGARLSHVEYGDVTADKEPEAMINIYPLMDGNCQCEKVFIYSMDGKNPKLLWSFETWDKAVGGFKRAYAENGDLVVELFGDNKFENNQWEFDFPEKSNGYCCPTAYTKLRFKWNGQKFEMTGVRELIDYDWNSKTEKR